MLAALVQQGIDRGEFRPVDPATVALLLVSIEEGLNLLWMLDPAVPWAEASEQAVRLLVAGLHRD